MTIVGLSSARWKFRDCSSKTWLSATVPGCVHKDLLAHGRIPDPFWGTNESKIQWVGERDWEYEAAFEASAELLGEESIELVADGLDTVATVSMNGRRVASTENMFIGYRFDIRPFLRRGRNRLSIRFDSAIRYIKTQRTEHRPRDINDPVGGCTVIRKQQCQFGWDWGPRFVTAGIWKDIRIEAWSGNRLEGVRVDQDHSRRGQVTLRLTERLARPEASATLRWRLSLGQDVVAAGEGREIKVPRPQLWWPNGQGEQPLYTLEVEARGVAGAVLGTWTRRIGLRTLVLDRHKDAWGESFQFVVNGRPVFAKGANWIPANIFVAGLGRQDYERDLRAAAEAHMNMIRVWGGGIYESEDFYDLCDELGLMVWQDFMFACTLYPGDAPFIASSRAEAEYQVLRLRHRACLALWCGNNEVWSINVQELLDPEKAHLRSNYERLFHRALPEVVEAHATGTAYWPSSPWRGDTDAGHAAGESRGDTHYWDVWHGRHPVKDYERWLFRFASEFGMQSYCSVQTQATFCPPDQGNLFGSVMEDHQKNRGGNQVILDYVSRRYRFPRDQEALIYLSQLNQAYCMETGILHYRRNRPRCMGALYWQLNDCWPVASWSSIEFTGRWRALHHVVRRLYAPSIAVANVPGEEVYTVNNYRTSSVRHVDLYAVHDGPRPLPGVLKWEVRTMKGRRVLGGLKASRLGSGSSRRLVRLDLGEAIKRHGSENLYLRVTLAADSRTVSDEAVLLTAPRFVDLPRARTRVAVQRTSPRSARLTFTSDAFQHRFCFDLGSLAHRASDNYFELFPGEARSVEVSFDGPVSVAEVRRSLTMRSLVDSF